MFSATRPFCLLFLIVPLAVHAEPVTVSSQSSGTISPHPVILERFGLDYWHYDGPDLAYTLSLRSTFDSDKVLDDGVGQLFISGAEVSMSLEIDGHSYAYSGDGVTRVRAYESGGYLHEISFMPPNLLPTRSGYRIPCLARQVPSLPTRSCPSAPS
jgi:hypothetical protein